MNTSQLDPVSVAIALAGVLFGPALASIIGPYAVIIISPTVGAAWALWRRDPCRTAFESERLLRHLPKEYRA